jgi:hypothetical protein
MKTMFQFQQDMISDMGWPYADFGSGAAPHPDQAPVRVSGSLLTNRPRTYEEPGTAEPYQRKKATHTGWRFAVGC